MARPRRKSTVTSTHTVSTAIDRLGELRPDFDRLPRPRVVAFAAGKGGAGKTTCSANFAAMIAAAGYRTLVVDLDVQANQAVLLGVGADPVGMDGGKGFTAAVVTDDAGHVRPIRDVRPGLDLVAAGAHTRKLSDYLVGLSPDERRRTVRNVVEQLATDYDVVVIDSRPAGEMLGEVALLASDYLVVPTRTDSMSWDQGLDTIARLYDDTDATARLLGVVLFATQRGAERIQADTRAAITAKLGGVAPVLGTVIYASEKAAKDQSEAGLLAEEYANAAAALHKPFWEDPDAPRFAANSAGSASDHASLAVEVIEEMLKPAEAGE
ncbi:MAG: ParA family protein [Actinomycetota bacterium]|nr:ParA family protein [Actinomycetota bacterium]